MEHGKCIILNDKTVITTAAILEQVEACEEAAKKKKNLKWRRKRMTGRVTAVSLSGLPLGHSAATSVLGLRDLHCELKKRTTRGMKILSTSDRGLSHWTSTCPLGLLHAGLA